ncbi:hypothetical protein P154DRAFT_534259 [Amniculicola lignicola CBS 123094]|uniref:Uncharacterized protein n=1 Tax=Amniculicola lignicola CBS 123094 TaxID=1392246 RepID=A0A6A5WJD3_9PLEO|nr:hypothetical protein P154DRAFT_534259 [Amniculicola lignicola CBS 123094]
MSYGTNTKDYQVIYAVAITLFRKIKFYKDPTVLVTYKDPIVLVTCKDPTVLVTYKDPIVLVTYKDPIELAVSSIRQLLVYIGVGDPIELATFSTSPFPSILRSALRRPLLE